MELADIDIGQIVLHSTVHNPHYASKVVSYISPDYFSDNTERAIAETIIEFHQKYHKTPNHKEVVVMMRERSDVNQLDRTVLTDVLSAGAYNVTDNDWLIENTERYIRRRRVALAFEQTYGEFEKGDEVNDIANIFQIAQTFSFDSSIGHSYIKDAGLRYEYYTAESSRVSLMIAMMDKVTSGGVIGGTLNCYLAGTGTGKSLVMCDQAAKMAMAGYRVLYISLEMAEMGLAQRIDANLMDVDINKIKHMSQEDYDAKLNDAVQKMTLRGGDIIFKQYPTSTAHAGHFNNLLIEARNKGIEFDVIFVDYINICASNRSRPSDNSYTKIKNIAEELRALAIMWDVPVITATQTNKDGQTSADLDFGDVSESHGLSATLDFLWGLIATEEMKSMGRIMVRQIKSRYGDVNYYKRFPVGVERSKMRLFNLKESESNAANATQSAKPDPAQKSTMEKLNDSTPELDFGVLGSSTPDKK
ncbi:DNA primase-helicase subunit [Vibrio phage henriette 12B8]|uniref:DNA primase-helicase subunit n=1 Tax=Vibrio phage henriette 12B8 TaxID=573174 RepID=UPI0002C090A3|nr:DNA primase-helicase subunit [Vibrio phage henriette 12B8]AGG58168.1 DNA primase-helicase subunit [Vibrio phage henriette 12B8]